MNPNSLSFRLMVSSAAWTLLILSVAAAILISIYRNFIEDSFDQRLNQYLEYLITKSAPQSGLDLRRPDNLGEPLFIAPLSGTYWQIRPTGAGTEPVFKSESLVGETFKTPSDLGVKADSRRIRQAYVEGPDGQILRVLERDIAFSQGNETRSYSFSVGLDAASVDAEIADFTNSITVILGLLGAGLLLATFFQVRFTLSPLRELQRKLHAIRAGEETKLDGSFPAEIAPLQDELNALIEANANIVARARTHVGNLAHALKTPLSVIINESSGNESEFARKVRQQAGLMRHRISHYLDRAQIAAQTRPTTAVTDVASVLNLLARALGKIYETRGLDLSIDCPPGLRFSGEKEDFEEMAGNLMDNACKWAKTSVSVRAELVAQPHGPAPKTFELVIEDDGPGLPESFRKSAVQRGRRLDETVPGSGLGLSIVADLSHLYRGFLKLEEATGGGLRARLVLPAV